MINALVKSIHNELFTKLCSTEIIPNEMVLESLTGFGIEKSRSWVKKTTLIETAWLSSNMAPTVFKHFSLPHCNQCAVRFDETLEEASEAYAIPLEQWLVSLNFYCLPKRAE